MQWVSWPVGFNGICRDTQEANVVQFVRNENHPQTCGNEPLHESKYVKTYEQQGEGGPWDLRSFIPNFH